MKKVLYLILFSLVLCLMKAPVVHAKEVFTATEDEMKVMPGAEYNAEMLSIAGNSVYLDGHQLLYAEIDCKKAVTTPLKAYAFDESGTYLGEARVSLYKSGIYLICFDITYFSGTKNVMIAVYNYDEETGLYNCVSAKKGVVKSMDWNGSVSKSQTNFYSGSDSTYIAVSLPIKAKGKWNRIYLYDGEEQIAHLDMAVRVETTGVVLNSLLPELESPVEYGISVTQLRYEGDMIWSRVLEAGKTYTFKALVNNDVYELGTFLCEDAPYVGTYPVYDLYGNTPAVGLNSFGYNFSDLVLKVQDKTTGEILATSEGEHNFLCKSKTKADVIFETDRTIEQLVGQDLIVFCNGSEIYRGTYQSSQTVVARYYDHVNNVLALGTYNVPDGAVVTASIYKGYEATGTVKDNMVYLTFTKDGEVTRLPVGTVSISCVIETDTTVRTSCSLDIMGHTQETDPANVNVIVDPYRYNTAESSLEYIVSKSLVGNADGEFSLTYENCYGVDYPLTVTATETIYNGVECWSLKGALPVLEPVTSQVTVYKGDTSVATNYLYVMDPETYYARIDTYVGDDDKIYASIELPFDGANYDTSKIYLSVTNLLAEELGVNAVRTDNTERLEYRFENVPDDLTKMAIWVKYNAGWNVMDLDSIHVKGALLLVIPAQVENYRVDVKTVTDENHYDLAVAFKVSEPSYVYVTDARSERVLKKWQINNTVDYTYLTEEMLSGLKYDSAEMAYDFYFEEINGNGVSTYERVYPGVRLEPIVVSDGIGRDADGNYWLYRGGEIYYEYTGLFYWANVDSWVMIVAGKWDTSYTALTLYNDIWWYVENGYVNFTFTGLVTLGDTKWYVTGGHVDFTYQGLLCYNNDWFYIVNGAVDKNFNGLAFVNNDWWYVVSGQIDFGFTGLAYVNSAWWYVNQGKIDFTYTGLVFFGEDWWYVENGCLNGNYNGLAYVNDNWWYVVWGKIDFSYCGLFFFNNDWWYVQGGMIDFAYTGLTYFNDSWWYVENGKINFNYYSLAYVNDNWWYVQGGVIDFNYTGLVFFNGDWWYVSGARVDFAYNGTAVGPDGNLYNVVDGKVVSLA